jgi:hypothetical protein
VTYRMHARAGASLAIGLTAFALNLAGPASARTFDFNSTGSIVQRPLPPGYACAMRRALLDRQIPCRTVHGLGHAAHGQE